MLDYIHLVLGVTNFPSTSNRQFKQISGGLSNDAISSGVSPSFLNQFYNIDYNNGN